MTMTRNKKEGRSKFDQQLFMEQPGDKLNINNFSKLYF